MIEPFLCIHGLQTNIKRISFLFLEDFQNINLFVNLAWVSADMFSVHFEIPKST